MLVKKSVGFEFKVVVILITVLTLVTITGVFAYFRFTKIVNSVSEASRTDLRLVTSKSLMNSLRDAENSAKSYSLTDDTQYLERFFEAASLSYDRLDSLEALSVNRDTTHLSLHNLDSLVIGKLAILNELLIMQDKFRVEAALEKVTDKIESSKISVTVEEDSETKRKRKFLDVFKSKKKKEEEEAAAASNKEHVVELDELNKEIARVQREEKTIEMSLKEQELGLLSKDKNFTKSLVQLLDDFERSELEQIEDVAKQAKEDVEKTNLFIALFCILAGILLVFISYLIVNFVRRNNQYKKALRIASDEANNLAKTKENFLANMSHEIRTPMNAVVGFAEQLSQTNLSDNQKDQVSMIQKSAHHLIYIINDVLDFTKLQNGKLRLEKIPFNPIEIAQEIESYEKLRAEQKGVRLKLKIENELPNYLLGDPFRLRQVLLNLVSNAIKFTDKGSVELIISWDEASNVLIAHIKDTGIGMSEEFIEKMFQDFEQAEESTTRNYGGTGLGLSISKMIIELHNGAISVSSELGKGTDIKVVVPYKLANQKDIESIKSNHKSNFDQLAGIQVLVVDDEAYNRKLIATILDKYQIKYKLVNDGEEAVNETVRGSFDAILMDARMPNKDGIEATKEIRLYEAQKKLKEVPIIVLSAAVTTKDQEEFETIGMNAFLPKPFKEKDLLQTLFNCIKDKKIINQMNEQESVSFESLRALSGDDISFYKDMLETFIKSTAEGIKNIEIAAQNNDFEMVADQAHKISSPCKHLGATQLYMYLKELEEICREGKINPSGTIKKVKRESDIVLLKVKNELETIV